MNGILFPVKAIDTKSKTTEIKKTIIKIFLFFENNIEQKIKKNENI